MPRWLHSAPTPSIHLMPGPLRATQGAIAGPSVDGVREMRGHGAVLQLPCSHRAHEPQAHPCSPTSARACCCSEICGAFHWPVNPSDSELRRLWQISPPVAQMALLSNHREVTRTVSHQSPTIELLSGGCRVPFPQGSPSSPSALHPASEQRLSPTSALHPIPVVVSILASQSAPTR